MFDLLKKIENGTNTLKPQESCRKAGTIVTGKSHRTSKSKTIVKERTDIVFEKLRREIATKIERVQQKFNEIILEDSSIEESERSDRLDDWEEQNDNLKFSSNKMLGVASRVAEKEHAMAPRKPNELTDEELSERGAIK